LDRQDFKEWGEDRVLSPNGAKRVDANFFSKVYAHNGIAHLTDFSDSQSGHYILKLHGNASFHMAKYCHDLSFQLDTDTQRKIIGQ
jgi:hypothetical protein